ncbi:hypothetical protein PT7_P006 (plasmid) [Pusillimonas sp. T7-7]|nr:hypothetical protein PT7_P006 [Pusillimonas sp. T7-7]
MAWEKQHIWPGNRPIRMRFPSRAQPDDKENEMEYPPGNGHYQSVLVIGRFVNKGERNEH